VSKKKKRLPKVTVAVTVKSRWKIDDYPEPGTREAVLVHPVIGTVKLPWWPEDIEQGDLARTYSEFARPGRAALLTPEARPLDTYNLSFALLDRDYGGSVAPILESLRRMADATKPVSLVLAKSARGLFHVTGLSIVERDHTARGNPRWADVSMTLKRASDYTVKVGPVVSGGGSGFATGG
jgi:hypothetical protein